MPVGDADFAVAAVAAVIAEDERRDPRQVGPERQHDQVGQQPRVLAKILWDTGRPGHRPLPDIDRRLRPFDPLLDLANAVEVFIELAAISDTESVAQSSGVLSREVENAFAFPFPA